MALPRGMRYLAGATICMFLYLFTQILKSPGSEIEMQLPSKLPDRRPGIKLSDWNLPPQIDSTISLPHN